MTDVDCFTELHVIRNSNFTMETLLAECYQVHLLPIFDDKLMISSRQPVDISEDLTGQCKDHAHDIEWYCKDDDEILCSSCLRDHIGHDIKELSHLHYIQWIEKAEQLKSELQIQVLQCNQQIASMQESCAQSASLQYNTILQAEELFSTTVIALIDKLKKKINRHGLAKNRKSC